MRRLVVLTLPVLALAVAGWLLAYDPATPTSAQAPTYLMYLPFVTVPIVSQSCSAEPLPPVDWDPRLGPGPDGLPHLEDVRIINASVAPCEQFWRAVSVKFEDDYESGGNHNIYVKILDENGERVSGVAVQFSSDVTGEVFPQPEEKPPGDACDCNYDMPIWPGDVYSVQITGDLPTDIVAGMLMPENRHVNYRITFQLATNPDQ